jgi:single-strand DNA-binding protein
MFQKIIIVGHLGRDPEMRCTPTGASVTNFPLATTRVFPGADGEQRKETAWFRVTAWGKLGEVCNQYLHKGSKVLIEGRLSVDPATGGPRIYQKQDGTAGASFEVTAGEVKFLSSRTAAEETAPEHELPPGSPTTDDLPF